MFSNCEDDLCIFVCGTCKRYFTQLSAFSQHKKEKLCKKNNALQQNWFAANMMIPNLMPHGHGNTEEVDSDTALDQQELGDCSNEHLMNNEGAEFSSQKRKYPRKQDKTKIKRTVRDFEHEEQHALLARGEPAAHGHCPDDGTDQNMFPPFPTRPGSSMFGKPTENAAACRHPVYICKTCHMEFPRQLTGKPFKCLHCRRGFLTERDLKVHVMRAKHDNLCDVCGKIFPDKYKLRKHTLSHMTEKNFPCDIPGCGKAFKSAEDVRTHVKYVHASEKRFRCELCGRAFTRPDKYKQHMETHSRKITLPMSALAGQQPLADSNNAYGSTAYKALSSSVSDETVMYENSGQLSPMAEDDELPSMAAAIFRTEAPTTNPSLSSTTATTRDEVSSMVVHENHSGDLGDSANDSSNVMVLKTEEDNPPRSNVHNNSTFYQVSSSSRPSGGTYTTAGDQVYHMSSTSRSSATDAYPTVEPRSVGPGSLNQLEATSVDHDPSAIPPTATTTNTSKNNPNSSITTVSKVEPMSPPEYNLEDAQSPDDHMIEHAAMESLEPSEECTRCLSHFRSHQDFLVHEERRPDQVHRCQHCSQKFLNICELRCHSREIHNVEPEEDHGPVGDEAATIGGQREFAWKHSCKECGKAFTRPDKLRRHSIIHSPDRPCIPCMCRESHGCMLTFHRKDSMKRHALAHTRGKPYKCYLCDKTFSRQDYVNKHLNQVHNQVFKHNCPFCDYGTLDPRRLKAHVRSKHKADANSVLPPELSFLDDDDSDTELLPGADTSPTTGEKSPSDPTPGDTTLSMATPGDKSPPAPATEPGTQFMSPNLVSSSDLSPSEAEAVPSTYISPRLGPPEERPTTKTEPGTYAPPNMSTPRDRYVPPNIATSGDRSTSETDSLPSSYVSPNLVSHHGRSLPEVETSPRFPERRLPPDNSAGSDPLPFSDTPEMAVSRGMISGYVGQQSGRHRSFLNTIPQGTMHHYSPAMSANSVLNSPDYPHYPGQNFHMMPSNPAEHTMYSANQVYRSRHKSPLNSLTVPPTSTRQQSDTMYGVSDITGSSRHNVFS